MVESNKMKLSFTNLNIIINNNNNNNNNKNNNNTGLASGEGSSVSWVERTLQPWVAVFLEMVS